MDPRHERLAELLIHHSTRLQAGEHVLIEAFDIPESMVIAAVKAAKSVGAHPHVTLRNNRLQRALIEDATDAQVATQAEYDRFRMEKMDAYLGLRGGNNANELAGLSGEDQKRWSTGYQTPVHFQQRVNHTRWCVLRWPAPGMAQSASMSTESYEDFYFRVCTMDYARMAQAVEPLKARMNAADQVHICGPGDTDLKFSIKDIPSIPCCGNMNIPDGEIFTAPIRDSVNGVMQYNTPTRYQGNDFANVRLVFKDGKIVEHDADKGAEHLEAIFDTDEGARFVGEFAIGFNPFIMHAQNDILFDEKIAGSLHFTPGNAYEDANNGNKSSIHWDMVLIQRSDYGGGTIAFDGEVIRKDGLFVPTDLQALNPDHLGA